MPTDDRDDSVAIVRWLIDVAWHCHIPADEVYDVVDGPTGQRLIDAARPLVHHHDPYYRDPANVAASFYDHGGQPRYASGLLKAIRKVAAEADNWSDDRTPPSSTGDPSGAEAPSGPSQPIVAIGDRVDVPGFPTGTVENVTFFDGWGGDDGETPTRFVEITVRFDHVHYLSDGYPLERMSTVQEEWIEWGMTVIDDTTDTTEEAIA